jgi:hypothetical protein
MITTELLADVASNHPLAARMTKHPLAKTAIGWLL